MWHTPGTCGILLAFFQMHSNDVIQRWGVARLRSPGLGSHLASSAPSWNASMTTSFGQRQPRADSDENPVCLLFLSSDGCGSTAAEVRRTPCGAWIQDARSCT